MYILVYAYKKAWRDIQQTINSGYLWRVKMWKVNKSLLSTNFYIVWVLLFFFFYQRHKFVLKLKGQEYAHPCHLQSHWRPPDAEEKEKAPSRLWIANRWNTTNNSNSQFSHSVMSDSLRPHELQHARPPCPSPTPGVHPNPFPLSRWCHPTISSSVIPFSSCPQSFLASGSFPMSQLFASGGQIIGVSASTSVLPMNTQDWSPLGWTGWISLQSKGFSRVSSNTAVQKNQFFSTQLSLYYSSHIHTWPLEKTIALTRRTFTDKVMSLLFNMPSQFSQFSHSVVSNSLRPHESQHARPPCPSPTPGVHSDLRPSSQWYHPAILSSVIPFSSCPQSLPACRILVPIPGTEFVLPILEVQSLNHWATREIPGLLIFFAGAFVYFPVAYSLEGKLWPT